MKLANQKRGILNQLENTEHELRSKRRAVKAPHWYKKVARKTGYTFIFLVINCMMGRVRMDSNINKHQTIRKAKDRKQKFMELIHSEYQCCCGLKGNKGRRPMKGRIVKFADLPEEIIIKILSYLSVVDLLKFEQVSVYFESIVNHAHVTWANVSFQYLWPNSTNITVFKKAAECGNIECLAKLAFVSLYIYNFKETKKSLKTSLENANKAVECFSRIDHLISPDMPLTWMFIRPPWAYPAGVRKCLKECMLNKLEQVCASEKVSIPSLYNVGKTFQLKEDQSKERAGEFFERAAKLGCPFSKWELHKTKCLDGDEDNDAGVMLETIRNLQDIASKDHFHAVVDLCKRYAASDFGSIGRKAATDYCKKVMDMRLPSGIHNVVSNHSTTTSKITENMRCILVNWMHEVCDVKSMQSEALHMAVDCLDRFLLNRNVYRKQLQLIGISCVVLASKVFSANSTNLLTIRESAWLTDSTYEYNEVVRTLAEIIGALKGKLVKMNTNYFGEIMCAFAELDDYNRNFLHYLIDSSLQFCDFGSNDLAATSKSEESLICLNKTTSNNCTFKPSLVAAAATMLTLIVNKSANVWPSRMIEFTGYEVKDLANCVALLHIKCLLDKTVIVDGEYQICGAKDRYSTMEYMEVAKRPVPSLDIVRSCIDDLEPRLRSEIFNGGLRFYFKEEKNILDLDSDASATSSFLCGYDGDEEDNKNQSICDTSLFCGKEQMKPTLDGFIPDAYSEETNKFSLEHFQDDSDVGVTKLDADRCACGPLNAMLGKKKLNDVSMDKLTAVFSTACSCSSSASCQSGDTSGRSSGGSASRPKPDVKKRSFYTRRRYPMRLRSSLRNRELQDSKMRVEKFDMDRERRKRPANWPVGCQSKQKGSLRPKMDVKTAKRNPGDDSY